MSQNATELNDKQQRAIELLTAGRTVVETSELCGCSRRSVHRWLSADPQFLAALNQAREERRQTHVNALEALVADAIENVRQSIESGDVRTSLRLLERIGILDAAPIGETDVQEIIDQRDKAETESAIARKENSLQNTLFA